MNPSKIPFQRKVFQRNKLVREYLVFGNGTQVVVAFHGFGSKAEEWLVFFPWLKKYKVYAFNDFMHGASSYPAHRIAKNTLTKQELNAFFKAFLKQEHLDAIVLMGYSLGGKTALSLLETMPQCISSVWLFAPDGIRLSYWYVFASRTWLGRNIFRSIIRGPGWFFRWISILNKSKLLSDKIHSFLMIHLETQEKRQLVFDVWMIYRKIQPNMAQVKKEIEEHKIEVELFFGKYDRVIPVNIGTYFQRKAPKHIRLHQMDTGHLLLNKKTLKYIQSL